MTALLSLENVSVSYGRIEAVREVSVVIEPGRIVTIIGPNGAGKTTLMQAAMGLLPSSGTMRFDGDDLAGVDVETRVERGMCLVPERRELFHDMNVLDNLTLGAFSRRASADIARDLDDVFERFPRLKERRRQLAGTLSGGERQMLAMGRALMAK
ncbi:MAG TPA: ATP-binding cassette domain-containing protein, partial [Rhodoblastus sp.]|nr:ATP-binding cassette domain-containing protein [Rhodoblastus sp.]